MLSKSPTDVSPQPTQETIPSPLQNLSQQQEEMHSPPPKWLLPLSGTSEILPTAMPKYTSLYSTLMTHRSALWNNAEQICLPHVTDKCLQIAIIFLKSYLYIENNIPSFRQHSLRTFSSSTNILYYPEKCSLSIILFRTTHSQIRNKQGVWHILYPLNP